MKIFNSKALVTLLMVVVIGLITLRFATIQNLNIDSRNFYLYNIDGGELFKIYKDSNGSVIKLYNREIVTIKGAKEIGESLYRVTPSTYIDIRDGDKKMVYKAILDSNNSLSLPVRGSKYEIVGGREFENRDSFVRLNNRDRPLLLLMPKDSKEFNSKTNSLKVLALKGGLRYIDIKGRPFDIPRVYSIDGYFLNRNVKPIELTQGGTIVISDKEALEVYLKKSYRYIKRGDNFKKVEDREFKFIYHKGWDSKIKALKLVFASNNLYFKRGEHKFIKAPLKISLKDGEIRVKGNKALFNYSKYKLDSDFVARVPILDKPRLKRKNSYYYDYLDIDNLYGLFVSDESATVYYSKDGKRWVEAKNNSLKYAPPIYLEYPDIEGQYIAPLALKNYKGDIYYKIISPTGRYQIAFNGDIETKTVKITRSYRELVDINSRNLIIKTRKRGLEKCTQEKPNLLSCLYSRGVKDSVISLYDERNMVDLIPRKFLIENSKPNKNDTSKDRNTTNILDKLLPIYGDGKSFGLLAKRGVEESKLTVDKRFSLKIADIFEKEIKALLNSSSKMVNLKRNREIIEGAVVVMRIGKGKRELVGLFSYPYPKFKNLEREKIINVLRYRYSKIRNRAFDLLVHPGSTFKIITSATLLNSFKRDKLDFKVLKGREDLFETPFRDGYINFHLRNYMDSRGFIESTLYTDLPRAFALSYNTYFGYGGLLLHKRLDRRYLDKLYPVILDKEERENEYRVTTLTDRLYFNRKIPLSREYNIEAKASRFPTLYLTSKEVADSAIGQFEIYTTPIQMATVVASVYDNKIAFPTLIKGEEPIEVKDKFLNSLDNLKYLQRAMYLVTSSSEGTARRAFANFRYRGIRVYGKTGTAQKGRGNLYDTWFVMFTKGLKENDIAVVTLIRNGNTGGREPARVSRKVLEAWIKYIKTEKGD